MVEVMLAMPASNGYVLLDPMDRGLFESHRWCIAGAGYVMANVGGRMEYLHRQILGLTPGDGMQADHRNRRRTDCRRSNLRVATCAQNMQNQPGRGRSRFRGVTWNRNGWIARVKVGDVTYRSPRMASEEDAARLAAAWRAEHMPFSAEAAA